MSVYTCINFNQLERFLGRYPLGQLTDFQGIAAGIDNSNYAASTTEGEFILTIFESLDFRQVSKFLDLLSTLCHLQYPCPQPQLDNQHHYLGTLNNKPAAIFKRIAGICVTNPTTQHCHAVGEILAKLHVKSQDIDFQYHNRKGNTWLQNFATHIIDELSIEDQLLLADELKFQTHNQQCVLPHGIIHADLFRDNVLFKGNQLTGVLDFYSACQGNFVLDIAIAINDWCVDEQQQINDEKTHDLILAYESKRTLTSDEKNMLPVMLRWAALRFWLSRIGHQQTSSQAAITTTKDPTVFKNLLQCHRSRAI
jgi:homoserine kinase type II